MKNNEGKYVIGKIRKTGDTKVCVHDTELDSTVNRRMFAWNAFTYTRCRNVPAGTYFFKVTENRKDRNGHDNIVVIPVRLLGGTDVLKKYVETISFMCLSGNMAEEYWKYGITEGYDKYETFSISKAASRFPDAGDNLPDVMLEAFLKNELSLDEAHDLLHRKVKYRGWLLSEWDSKLALIYGLLSAGKLKEMGFPRTEKKLKEKIDEAGGISYDGRMSDPLAKDGISVTRAYADQMNDAYIRLFKEGCVKEIAPGSSETDILERCEAVALYYEEKKKKEKEEKRKNRQQKRKETL